MRRGGFTLLELVLASTLSSVIMAAVLGLLYGVWFLAKGAADELQGALHARALREQLFYRLCTQKVNGIDNYYGLISANDISLDEQEFRAAYTEVRHNNDTGLDETVAIWSFATTPNDKAATKVGVSEIIDWNPTSFKAKRTSSSASASIKKIYLKNTYGKTIYYDRLVAPLPGDKAPTTTEIMRAFDGK